jgi:hypothetical protein
MAVLAGLVALVLLLHAWLLGTLPALPGVGGPGKAPRVLQVRQVRQILAQPAPVALAADSAAAPEAPRTSPPRRALPAPAAAPVKATPAVAPDPAPPWPPAAAGGTAPPVYPTRLPPAVTLQYAVQREGAVRAGGLQAELRWRPADDGRYELTMSLAATGWASVGMVDEHGLAPERQVETRRGREVRAANFQRDSGRITFSGPQLEFPLLPGAQDRLSWLLQLAAVLEANPGLAGAGGEVTLFVAGPCGDAGPWTFKSQGAETAELPAGATAGAVHLRRSPDRPYDTRVDVWLDPARHHLPVRLRLHNRAEIEPTDFVLQALSLP